MSEGALSGSVPVSAWAGGSVPYDSTRKLRTSTIIDSSSRGAQNGLETWTISSSCWARNGQGARQDEQEPMPSIALKQLVGTLSAW
jgi:hypothetical protein